MLARQLPKSVLSSSDDPALASSWADPERTTMNQDKLVHLKQKLAEKKVSLANLIVRAEDYGREKDIAALDSADMAVETYTKEFMFGKSAGDRVTLHLIEMAIERIEDGTFGCCAHCEEPIQPKRLDAIPWAPYCFDCQSLREKGRLQN